MEKNAKRKRENTGAGDESSSTKKGARSSSEGGESSVVAAIDAAYMCVDGYQIARDEKRRQREAGVFIEGLQYGEVKASAFATALSWCQPQPGESFIDLGSGTGSRQRFEMRVALRLAAHA